MSKTIVKTRKRTSFALLLLMLIILSVGVSASSVTMWNCYFTRSTQTVSCQTRSGTVSFEPGPAYCAVRTSAEKTGKVWTQDPYRTSYFETANPTQDEAARATVFRSIVPDRVVQVTVGNIEGERATSVRFEKEIPKSVGEATFSGVKQTDKGEVVIYDEPVEGTRGGKKSVAVDAQGNLYNQQSDGTLVPMTAQEVEQHKLIQQSIAGRGTLPQINAQSGAVAEVIGGEFTLPSDAFEGIQRASAEVPPTAGGMTQSVEQEPRVFEAISKDKKTRVPIQVDETGRYTSLDSKGKPAYEFVQEGEQIRRFKLNNDGQRTGTGTLLDPDTNDVAAFISSDMAQPGSTGTNIRGSVPTVATLNVKSDTRTTLASNPVDVISALSEGTSGRRGGDVGSEYTISANSVTFQDIKPINKPSNGEQRFDIVRVGSDTVLYRPTSGENQRVLYDSKGNPKAIMNGDGSIIVGSSELASAPRVTPLVKQPNIERSGGFTSDLPPPDGTIIQGSGQSFIVQDGNWKVYDQATGTVGEVASGMALSQYYSQVAGQQVGGQTPTAIAAQGGGAGGIGVKGALIVSAVMGGIGTPETESPVVASITPSSSAIVGANGKTLVTIKENTRNGQVLGDEYISANGQAIFKVETVDGKQVVRKYNAATGESMPLDDVVATKILAEHNTRVAARTTVSPTAVVAPVTVPVVAAITPTSTAITDASGKTLVTIKENTRNGQVLGDEYISANGQAIFKVETVDGKQVVRKYNAATGESMPLDDVVATKILAEHNTRVAARTTVTPLSSPDQEVASRNAPPEVIIASPATVGTGDSTEPAKTFKAGKAITLDKDRLSAELAADVNEAQGAVVAAANTQTAAQSKVTASEAVLKEAKTLPSGSADKAAKIKEAEEALKKAKEERDKATKDLEQANAMLQQAELRQTQETQAANVRDIYSKAQKPDATQADKDAAAKAMDDYLATIPSNERDASRTAVEYDAAVVESQQAWNEFQAATTEAEVDKARARMDKASKALSDKGAQLENEMSGFGGVIWGENMKATIAGGGGWVGYWSSGGEEMRAARGLSRLFGYDEDYISPWKAKVVDAIQTAFDYNRWIDKICLSNLKSKEGKTFISPSGYTSVDIEGEYQVINPCGSISTGDMTLPNGTVVNCRKYYKYKITGEAVPAEVEMTFDVYLNRKGQGSKKYDSQYDLHPYNGTKIHLNRSGERWSFIGPSIFNYESYNEYDQACIQFTEKSFANLKLVITALSDDDNPLCNEIKPAYVSQVAKSREDQLEESGGGVPNVAVSEPTASGSGGGAAGTSGGVGGMGPRS